MTEVVDKTLIERLILEHSDRLELEINQKARADAWKFYYRVRVDHVIRPFAVCKVCFRVLHCDSRSGTASLLRHPCNPLSERSPVNRAVKLTAKLNLPPDGNAHKAEAYKTEYLKEEANTNSILRDSPISLIGGGPATTSCPSPTNTGSPPTATQPSISASITANATANNNNNNNARKRKVGGVPTPAFPLDLRLLHLPQMMAAVAAHPLAALNLANATAILTDPQHLQHLQQQQSQLEHLIREHHQQLQQERELKRNREEDSYQHDRTGSPAEASSSSPNWGRPRVKKERADTSEEVLGHSEENRDISIFNGSKARGTREENEDFSASPTKEVVQHLVNVCSPRVAFTDKDSGGSHYISDVWTRFQMVYVDGVLRPFAACKLCRKVVTYTKYSGTGGLLRHRCSNQEGRHFDSSTQENFIDHHTEIAPSPMSSGDNHDLTSRVDISYTSSPRHSSREGDTSLVRASSDEIPSTPTTAMAGVARALLRYMCQDFVAANTLDSPAFHQLVWSVLNLGAAHGTIREEESLPTSKQLLQFFLQPMVSDSKEVIARSLQDQTYLCLSMNHRQAEDGEILAVAVHCITQSFELQTHALGTKKLYKGDSREEAVNGLVRDFFNDILPLSSLREKYITVMSDEGEVCELGSASVRCLWHSVESVLENLTDVSAYAIICDEIRTVLTHLAETGVDGVASCGLRANEVHRWEALLHAISFVVRHFDELQTVLSDNPGYNNISVLTDREIYEEVKDLLLGVQRCLMTVRDPKRPTLNQAVLCRAKLLQLCSSPAVSSVTHQVKEFLSRRFEKELCLAPLHLVASFLDPRCKSLKVLSESEKSEVHRLVLEMMKGVSVTEANSGVLNLKTTRRSSSPAGYNCNRTNSHPEASEEAHPFREYMDNPSAADLSVSDSEEIMAYVNMKVHLDDDDILRWWAGPSASGLPTLRRLARKILAVPATCAFACQMTAHALAVSDKMGIADHCHLNNIIHMKYNMN